MPFFPLTPTKNYHKHYISFHFLLTISVHPLRLIQILNWSLRHSFLNSQSFKLLSNRMKQFFNFFLFSFNTQHPPSFFVNLSYVTLISSLNPFCHKEKEKKDMMMWLKFSLIIFGKTKSNLFNTKLLLTFKEYCHRLLIAVFIISTRQFFFLIYINWPMQNSIMACSSWWWWFSSYESYIWWSWFSFSFFQHLRLSASKRLSIIFPQNANISTSSFSFILILKVFFFCIAASSCI